MTEFISRNYGNEEYEVIIKTDSKEHYEATVKFARMLVDHLKPGEAVAYNLSPTEPRWIPVSERLPEDNLPRFSNVKQIKVITALISDKGVRTVRSQMRYKDTWATGYQTIWRWKYSGSEITHWMPLPEPPKEETDG